MGKSYIFIKDVSPWVSLIYSLKMPWVSLIYSLKMAMGKSYIFIKDGHG